MDYIDISERLNICSVSKIGQFKFATNFYLGSCIVFYKQLFRLVWLSVLLAAIVTSVSSCSTKLPHDNEELVSPTLSLTDISVLWPVPTSADEVNALLKATTKIAGGSILPEAAFEAVIDMALNQVIAEDSFGNKKKIQFASPALKNRDNWKVVGFRIDPSAPSTNKLSIKNIGSLPQIRLVLQPVTVSGSGRVTVHDFAMHLPFSFVLNSEAPFKPDKLLFTSIVNDLHHLKRFLLHSDPKVSTDGELRVHPGLSNNVSGFAEEVEAFLSRHLGRGELTLVAFMGLAPRPEPWVFFDMLLSPLQTKVSKSQILFLLDTRRPVGPPVRGSNTNLGPKIGVSTAILFKPGAERKLQDRVTAGQESPLVKDIPDIIANPLYSNAVNTGCVSCHSETTRRHILKIGPSNEYAYKPEMKSKVQKQLLPTTVWNLRNFGWFAENVFKKPAEFISIRTANETVNALEFIHEHYKLTTDLLTPSLKQGKKL